MATDTSTTVARSIGEARPPELAKHSATTDVGETRPLERAAAITAAKSVGDGEAGPPEIAEYMVTATRTTVAKPIDETRPPERAKDSAAPAATTAAKSAGDAEAPPPEMCKVHGHGSSLCWCRQVKYWIGEEMD